MRWPKYWSFSFSIIPSKEIPGLISFRMDRLDLRAAARAPRRHARGRRAAPAAGLDGRALDRGEGEPRRCRLGLNRPSRLFFGTLHSDAYIFPFLLCFLLLFFSQLFVSPPQTAILLFAFLFYGKDRKSV